MEEKRIRKVRFYKQHSPESCGIACMLMILDYFKKLIPTVAEEVKYYNRFQCKVKYNGELLPGTAVGAVAYGLTTFQLDVTLAHASPELMENRSGYNPPDLHDLLLAYHKDYIQRAGQRLNCRFGEPITADYLRSELSRDRLILLEICVPGDADGIHDHVTHGILLYDTDGPDFLLMDPYQNKPEERRFRLTEEELMERINSNPYGPVALSAGRPEPTAASTGTPTASVSP